MRVIRRADCPPVPWKNGAGSTRELWRLDDAAGFLIRVSVAEIRGDQPFSRFPGIDRVIVQLDGPPMVLSVGGRDQPIATPFAFPGEADVTCRLSAPGIAHDLNLMVRRGAFRGRMELRALTPGVPVGIGGEDALSALLALTPCTLSARAQSAAPPIALAPMDMVLGAAAASLTPRDAGRCVRITARR